MNSHAPKAMFFDMDGTLIDWETGLEESWRAVCDDACRTVAAITPDALLAAINVKRDLFWSDPARSIAGRMDLATSTREIVQEALDSLACGGDGLAAAIATDYRARRDASLALYAGAIETLRSVRDDGVATALITNGAADSQRRTVERFGLAAYFDCIIIEGEFGCGKPDERVFRHALDAVACEPEQTWMIGDNLQADIETPRRLGMHTVWINAGGSALPAVSSSALPHRTIRSIAELL